MLGIFSCFFIRLQHFFFKLFFLQKSVKNTIIISVTVSSRLDPDQAQQYVGPDLGQNCLQRLSADNHIATGMGKSSAIFYLFSPKSGFPQAGKVLE